MTSREKLKTALAHEPGPAPFDIGGHVCSGMHAACVAALREYYGLDNHPVKVFEPMQMLGEIEEDLKEALGCDVEEVSGENTKFGFPKTGWKEWRMDNGLVVLVPSGFMTTTNAAGGHFLHPMGDTAAPPSALMPRDGYYFDPLSRQPDFDEDELDPRDNLEEYAPISQEALEYLAAAAKRAVASGRGVAGNFGGTALGDVAAVPGPALKHPRGIRDVEEWYVSTLTRQDFIHEVFQRQTDLAIENLGKIYDAVGDQIDVVYVCGADFGSQLSTLCSPETFIDLYMPYYQKVNNWIHGHTGWKTLKHSCGAVRSFIPLLIESGFDCLNPVQCSAAGMDPRGLKKDFGRDIVFWGGGVDTQRTLPFGTPEEVRREALERLSIFTEGGGYVFSAVHNIQANTPAENIAALVDAYKSFT
ncbi:MAG: methyltransferase [Defluviitaleaceae bacterium]|nr:methyltransferase [Defluviitaleaceae bacterium]